MTTHDKTSEHLATAMEAPTEPMDAPMTKAEHGRMDDAMQRPVEDSLSTSAASMKAAKKAAREHRSVARPRDLMGEGHEMPAGSDVMGKGHPMPPGSDVMGDRLYETEAEAESDPTK